jgi:hypothetical protein
LFCWLEAVVKVVKVAVLAAFFEIVKVVPKVVVLSLVVSSKDGAFRAWQAGA